MPVYPSGADERHEDSYESVSPHAWERDLSFEERLYEWMGRAPWLAISAASHFMLFFLLAVIPWGMFDQQEEVILNVTAHTVPEEVVDDPEPEELAELLPEEAPEEPTLVDSELPTAESDLSDSQDFSNDMDSNHDSPSDVLFTSELSVSDSIIGTGGGGSRYGGRFGSGNGSGSGRRGNQPQILRGLEWLAKHQDEDGKWDSDEFSKHDPVGDVCDGPGHAEHDVGLTGLALLAFLGNGNTTRRGPYKENVIRGIKWLRNQQDFESGLIGEAVGTAYLYDHAIASLALCEAYYFSKSPIIRSNAQKSINFITTARNPYGVWRYSASPNGDNDTSVTGWMIFALESAKQAGLSVDSQAFPDSLTWFDEMTNPASGRVGYATRGSVSARTTGVNDHFPPEKSEAMTAVALLCRFFLGQDPKKESSMIGHADLLMRSLPKWSEDGLTNDVYYWYYGSYAMYQMGGSHWRAWSRAMKPAMVETQRLQGSAQGSWDPNGPWGMIGGRVYSTAMMVLCLEVHFRYSRVLGAR